MNQDTALKMITKSLEEACDTEVNINLDTHLTEDSVLDSLDTINFLFELETATGLTIDDSTMLEKNLFKVSNLVDYIIASS